ncbi:hypothetical protein GQ600_6022 [Phytophthora cactorum]|nr:hypothetical protein GQ600_6022 [Phytophthora cactorum]
MNVIMSTLFSTLETRFSDRPMLQILEAAKTFPSMESVATKMQKEKIQSIFATKASPNEAFKLLGLDNVGDSVLSNPLFMEWMNYVKHGENRQNGGECVAETMARPGEVSKQAFGLLNLNNAGEQTLASPKFKTWAKYLNDFNQRYPDRKETMIDGIRANYIDIKLIPMLYAAQKDPRTKKLASNLQNAFVNKWLVAKEKPADLTWRFSTVTNAEEMIQRYVKKLDAMSTNTS